MFESIEDTNPNSHIIDQDQEEEEEPSISLDENGFPNEYEHHEISNGSSKDDTFAADFYRCGTDWSTLSSKQVSKCDSSKKMKQKDLFQIWGIKKQKISEVEENGKMIVKNDNVNHGGGGGSGLSLMGSSSRDQLFDVGSSRVGIENRKARPCPFYKKIPGLFRVLMACLFVVFHRLIYLFTFD